MHNYLTRDGILPPDFIGLCHEELRKYGIKKLNKKIMSGRLSEDGYFMVKDEGGKLYYSKKLLVATGLSDNLPEIEGFGECYGKSVFHCPYCDGWEVRNKKLGVYARNKEGWELALALKGWSPHVTLYTDGKNKVKPEQMDYLVAHEIPVIRTPIKKT